MLLKMNFTCSRFLNGAIRKCKTVQMQPTLYFCWTELLQNSLLFIFVFEGYFALDMKFEYDFFFFSILSFCPCCSDKKFGCNSYSVMKFLFFVLSN